MNSTNQRPDLFYFIVIIKYYHSKMTSMIVCQHKNRGWVLQRNNTKKIYMTWSNVMKSVYYQQDQLILGNLWRGGSIVPAGMELDKWLVPLTACQIELWFFIVKFHNTCIWNNGTYMDHIFSVDDYSLCISIVRCLYGTWSIAYK